MEDIIQFQSARDICQEAGISLYLFWKLRASGAIPAHTGHVGGREIWSAGALPAIHRAIAQHKREPVKQTEVEA